MRTSSATVANLSLRWVFRYWWSTLWLGRVQQVIHCICFQSIVLAFLSLYCVLFTYHFTLYLSPPTFYWTNSAFIRLCISFFYSIHFQSGHYSCHFLYLFLQYFITCTGLQTSCKEGLLSDHSCWWGVSYHLDSSRQSTFQTITFTIASTRLYSWHPLYPGTCWLSRSWSHKLALARGSEAHSLDCLQTWEYLHLDSNWARSPWWAILSSSQDSNHIPYALDVIKYSHSSFHVGWHNTDYQGPDSIQSLQPPIIPTGSVYSSRTANHYASSMTPSFSMQSQSMTHPHLHSSSTSQNPSLDLQCTEWWTCLLDMTNACCIQNSGTLWHSTVPWVLTASPQSL